MTDYLVNAYPALSGKLRKLEYLLQRAIEKRARRFGGGSDFTPARMQMAAVSGQVP
jgi:hypothetical protein